MKAELEAQQNLERIRMEKMVQSGGLFNSTANGGSMKGSASARPRSGTGTGSRRNGSPEE